MPASSNSLAALPDKPIGDRLQAARTDRGRRWETCWRPAAPTCNSWRIANCRPICAQRRSIGPRSGNFPRRLPQLRPLPGRHRSGAFGMVARHPPQQSGHLRPALSANGQEEGRLRKTFGIVAPTEPRGSASHRRDAVAERVRRRARGGPGARTGRRPPAARLRPHHRFGASRASFVGRGRPGDEPFHRRRPPIMGARRRTARRRTG